MSEEIIVFIIDDDVDSLRAAIANVDPCELNEPLLPRHENVTTMSSDEEKYRWDVPRHRRLIREFVLDGLIPSRDDFLYYPVTALAIAAYFGSEKCVKLLIDAGVDVNAVASRYAGFKAKALHYATKASIVDLIAEAGAELYALDSFGNYAHNNAMKREIASYRMDASAESYKADVQKVQLRMYNWLEKYRLEKEKQQEVAGDGATDKVDGDIVGARRTISHDPLFRTAYENGNVDALKAICAQKGEDFETLLRMVKGSQAEALSMSDLFLSELYEALQQRKLALALHLIDQLDDNVKLSTYKDKKGRNLLYQWINGAYDEEDDSTWQYAEQRTEVGFDETRRILDVLVVEHGIDINEVLPHDTDCVFTVTHAAFYAGVIHLIPLMAAYGADLSICWHREGDYITSMPGWTFWQMLCIESAKGLIPLAIRKLLMEYFLGVARVVSAAEARKSAVLVMNLRGDEDEKAAVVEPMRHFLACGPSFLEQNFCIRYLSCVRHVQLCFGRTNPILHGDAIREIAKQLWLSDSELELNVSEGGDASQRIEFAKMCRFVLLEHLWNEQLADSVILYASQSPVPTVEPSVAPDSVSKSTWARSRQDSCAEEVDALFPIRNIRALFDDITDTEDDYGNLSDGDDDNVMADEQIDPDLADWVLVPKVFAKEMSKVEWVAEKKAEREAHRAKQLEEMRRLFAQFHTDEQMVNMVRDRCDEEEVRAILIERRMRECREERSRATTVVNLRYDRDELRAMHAQVMAEEYGIIDDDDGSDESAAVADMSALLRKAIRKRLRKRLPLTRRQATYLERDDDALQAIIDETLTPQLLATFANFGEPLGIDMDEIRDAIVHGTARLDHDAFLAAAKSARARWEEKNGRKFSSENLSDDAYNDMELWFQHVDENESVEEWLQHNDRDILDIFQRCRAYANRLLALAPYRRAEQLLRYVRPTEWPAKVATVDVTYDVMDDPFFDPSTNDAKKMQTLGFMMYAMAF